MTLTLITLEVVFFQFFFILLPLDRILLMMAKKKLKHTFFFQILLNIVKIAVFTFIFVTLCRKFDDKNDMDNEGDNTEGLKKWHGQNEEV